MKRILLSAVFLLLFCVVPVSTYAQAVPTPTIKVPTCGIAGSTTANKCCETSQTVNQIVTQQTGAAFAALNVASGGMGVVFQTLVSLFLTNAGPDFYDSLLTKCYNGIPDPNAPAGSCTCIIPTTPVTNPNMVKLCDKFVKPRSTTLPTYQNQLAEYNKCIACAQGQAVSGRAGAGVGGYYSAIGCIQPDLGDFISNFVLRIGIGIAGIIAMACIIYSSIILQTSRGDAEAIQKARDQITSCIVGLIMIIFSVFILRLIGVDILRIPGFS